MFCQTIGSSNPSALESRLQTMRAHAYILDGDNVRHGLKQDLGFTDADRVGGPAASRLRRAAKPDGSRARQQEVGQKPHRHPAPN